MRIVLDTSAYSKLRQSHPEVIARVAAADNVLLPATVLGELHAAFRLGRRMQENVVALDEFLREPFVNVLSIGPDVARRYGELFADLRRAGTPLPINDVWIAAATIDAGGHLLTFDSDFDRIPRLDRTVLPQ